jgi:hypothetical protein
MSENARLGTRHVCLMVPDVDRERIAKLVEQHPYITRHALSCLALQLGLDLLVAHPERLPELVIAERTRRAVARAARRAAAMAGAA